MRASCEHLSVTGMQKDMSDRKLSTTSAGSRGLDFAFCAGEGSRNIVGDTIWKALPSYME